MLVSLHGGISEGTSAFISLVEDGSSLPRVNTFSSDLSRNFPKHSIADAQNHLGEISVAEKLDHQLFRLGVVKKVVDVPRNIDWLISIQLERSWLKALWLRPAANISSR